MIKIENITCEMGPQEKNFQLAIYFYSQGVEPIVSSSCSPIDSQLPQLRIQFCPTKKIRKCHTNPIFLIWGSFSNRKKKELYIYIYIYTIYIHHGISLSELLPLGIGDLRTFTYGTLWNDLSSLALQLRQRLDLDQIIKRGEDVVLLGDGFCIYIYDL